MRHNIIRKASAFSAVFTLFAFAACDLTGLKKADESTQQPATEATVVGIWRTNIPITTTTPPSDVKVTMQVDAEHTMLLSKRVATGQPAPYDFVEVSKENYTWSVADGKMSSTKTTCTYKDPATMQEIPGMPCQAPLSQDAPINVKGKAWTIVQGDQAIIFRKD